jgi:hypothetical protein
MHTANANMMEVPSLDQQEAWDSPILFDEFETSDIPAALLPGVLGEFAAALACTTETPESLSVMTVLGVLSTVVAKRFVVSPKDGWREPVNIYTLIALPPANNKSLVLNACTKPLLEWEQQQAIQHDFDIKRRRSERKTQEKIIEVLRAKAAKEQNSIEQRNLIDEITQKEASLGDIPVLPLLFTNDATPESLTNLVHEQGGRLAIFSDEGGILETLAGLYSNGVSNIDILLKGIDGGDVRVRRKDRSIMLKPFLTFVLTVQPAVIQKMGEKKVYLGNGTLERFLYVLPKSKLGYRTHDKPPLSSAIQKKYHDKIMSLLNYFAVPDKNKSEQLKVLRLSQSAYQYWKTFQATIEMQLRPDGAFASCQGWAGKISGFALRIAGLLHIVESELDNLMIADTTMKNALEMATALADHALAAFGLMGVDQTTEDAKMIYQWIKSSKKVSFTQTEIMLAMRNKKLGKTERLQRALQVLKNRNMISQPVKLPTRKPTAFYYVNPFIVSDSAS